MPNYCNTNVTPIERVMRDVVVLDNGCWQWQLKLDKDAYGQVTFLKEHFTAHVFSWVAHGNTIPVGEEIDHHCRNRGCVNPDHLESVPHPINMERAHYDTMYDRGVCKQGHRLTPTNIYFQGTSIICRTCTLDRTNARHARIRAERER